MTAKLISRIRGTLLAVGVVAAVSACDSLFAPRSLSGVYVLESLDRRTLPLNLWNDGVSRGTLQADTVVLDEQRSGVWIRTVEREYAVTPGTVERLTWTSSVSVRVVGLRELRMREWFEFKCGPAANCVEPRDFVLSAQGSALYLSDPEGTRRYRRVGDAP